MEIKNGRAGLNSVTFESETHRATATRKGKDIVVTKKVINNKPINLDKYISKVPFVRAYWAFFKLLANKFGAMYFLVCVILSYILVKYTPNSPEGSFNFKLFIIPLFIIMFFQMFTALPHYHGAEHKVANDYDKHRKTSVGTAIRESCVNINCGTNLFVGLMLVSILIYPVTNYLSILIGWGLNYELMRKTDNKVIKNIVRGIDYIGNTLQKYVFTKEPSREQLEVAVKAVRALEE